MRINIMDLINLMNEQTIPLLKTIVLRLPGNKRENCWNKLIERIKKEYPGLFEIISNEFNVCIRKSEKKDIDDAISIYKGWISGQNMNENVYKLVCFMKFSEIYQIGTPEGLWIRIKPLTFERLLKL